MIYEMSNDIRDMLVARKFPIPLVYGPEIAGSESLATRIVVERDRDAADQLGPPRGARANPRGVFTRELCGKATIYASSTIPGAHIGDHEHDCEQYIDAFLVAFREWCSSRKHDGAVFTELRYLKAEEFNAPSVWPGVAYVIRFRVPRGVFALTFSGDGRPTQKLGGFQNRTEVTTAGAEADPVIGCGEE
jgi:hypothetical protein